jgi:hypothetical protein
MKKIVIELDADQDQVDKAMEIFSALIKSGGLWGVRGGKTVLHFDSEGVFQAVSLDYYPWRKRKNLNNDSTTPR